MFFIGCQSAERPTALKGVESSAREAVSRLPSAWVRGTLALSDGRTVKVVADVPGKDGHDPTTVLETSRQLWEKAQEEGVSEADLVGSSITLQVEYPLGDMFRPFALRRFRLERAGLGIALPLLSRGEPALLGQVAELRMPDGRSVLVYKDPVTVGGVFDLTELKSMAQAVLGAAHAAGISDADIYSDTAQCHAMSVDEYLNKSGFDIRLSRDCALALANAEQLPPERRTLPFLDDQGGRYVFNVDWQRRVRMGNREYDIYFGSPRGVYDETFRVAAGGSEIEIRLPNGGWSLKIDEGVQDSIRRRDAHREEQEKREPLQSEGRPTHPRIKRYQVPFGDKMKRDL